MGNVVLVTGGAGFIGSQACRLLAEEGWSPVAFDNLSTGHADALGELPLVRGDVRDAGAVADALRAYGATAIMHFAAKAYVGESVHAPAVYWDNNVGGMIGLLQGARDAGVSRVVFSSTCATYGVPDRLPIREDDPQRPINPYGRTKLACEQMLRDFGVAYGMRHVALRYFNAAGADPWGRMGERHEPETHLIPLALMAASGRGGPLKVFGTDYDTPDGTGVRDYIHVHDLARAHALALRYLEEGGDSVALNLGTGQGTSVRAIVQAIEAMTGRPLPLIEEARRAGDPPVLTADPTRAAEVLGFRTRMSDMGTILRHAAPWFGLGEHDDKAA
jgi:UDP-arabinose 4-epimerase